MTTKEKAGKRKALLEKNVKRIVSTLREKYAPDRIILFGSLATGKVTETSDLDILVIKRTRKNFYDRLRDVAILCDYDVGADILVYTPKEFAEESKANLFFREEVVKKGKVLYDRAA